MVWEPGFHNTRLFLYNLQLLNRGVWKVVVELRAGGSRLAALDWQGTWGLPALLNVCGDVNFLWKLCHINFKPVLDVIEGFGIILVRHKSDG